MNKLQTKERDFLKPFKKGGLAFVRLWSALSSPFLTPPNLYFKNKGGLAVR